VGDMARSYPPFSIVTSTLYDRVSRVTHVPRTLSLPVAAQRQVQISSSARRRRSGTTASAAG
jgi:hypothetical protein